MQSTVERTFSNKEKSLTHPARIGRVLRFADLYSQLRSLPSSGLATILHKPIVRGCPHPAICLDCGFPDFTSPAGEWRVLRRIAAWTPRDYLLGADGVDGNVMEWTGSTTFTTAFSAGVDTWKQESKINIYYVASSPDITVSDIDDEFTLWAGKYFYLTYELKFNQDKLRGQTDALKQHVTTHELGHALGLDHSYAGNVMVDPSTSQTGLGWQDWRDYHYLWGY